MEWSRLLSEKRERQESTEKKGTQDIRNAFKKDYDTIVNNSSFRRLQDKCQVFPLEKYDYVRTRLTHSIEVESICENLGIYLESYLRKDINIEIDNNTIVTLLRAAALMHDLGNPPFGHFGEKCINEWYKENLEKIYYDNKNKIYKIVNEYCGNENSNLTLIKTLFKNEEQKINDFIKFDGNAQNLRLATKLQYVVDEFGMNLTYALMATIIKYPISSATESANKIGYFFSEKEIFDKIEKELDLGQIRHPLCFLLESADDIAYLSADLEDAHKKSLISIAQIEFLLEREEKDELCKNVLDSIDRYTKKANEIFSKPRDIETYVIQRLRIYIKGQLTNGVIEEFKKNYDDIMNLDYKSELLNGSKTKALVDILENIEKEYIFNAKEILTSEIEGHTIIFSLLDILVINVLNYNGETKGLSHKIYSIISENYKKVCENNCDIKELDNEKTIYCKLMLVNDFIAGMTDSYAKEYYKTLNAII